MKRMAIGVLGVALAALAAGCATTRPPQFSDEVWISHVTTGRGCFARGDFRRGADAFGRAQSRARALDDAEALAVASVDRAVCLLQLGRAAGALGGVEEALAEGGVSAARRQELQAAGARAELALGQPEAVLARTEELLKEKLPRLVEGQALLARAGAELALMDVSAAERTLAGLSSAAWRRLPGSLRAERAELEARLAAILEAPDSALAWQQRAIELWREAGRLPEIARALAAAGRYARATGNPTLASDCFWRSARSLWAQGLAEDAVAMLEEGRICAAFSQDEAASQRMADLLVTIRGEKRLEE